MFCPKCGKELDKKAKFCTSCGASISEPVKVEPTVVPTKTNKSDYGTLSLVFGIITFIFPIIIPLSIIGLIFGMKENQNGAKKNLGIVLNTVAIVIFTWIVVFISFIVLVAGSGIFERVEEFINDEIDEIETYQTIGDNEYGYVSIPSDWHQAYDITKENVLAYSHNSYSISLEIIGNVNSLDEALNKKLKELSTEELPYEETWINSYKGYKIETSNDDGKYIDVYVLQVDDNSYRAITMEGYFPGSKYFKLPQNYVYEIDYSGDTNTTIDPNSFEQIPLQPPI